MRASKQENREKSKGGKFGNERELSNINRVPSKRAKAIISQIKKRII